MQRGRGRGRGGGVDHGMELWNEQVLPQNLEVEWTPPRTDLCVSRKYFHFLSYTCLNLLNSGISSASFCIYSCSLSIEQSYLSNVLLHFSRISSQSFESAKFLRRRNPFSWNSLSRFSSSDHYISLYCHYFCYYSKKLFLIDNTHYAIELNLFFYLLITFKTSWVNMDYLKILPYFQLLVLFYFIHYHWFT